MAFIVNGPWLKAGRDYQSFVNKQAVRYDRKV